MWKDRSPPPHRGGPLAHPFSAAPLIEYLLLWQVVRGRQTVIKPHSTLVAGAILLLFSRPAFAGPTNSSATASIPLAVPAEPPPRLEASINSSYTAPGEAKIDGAKLGKSDAFALAFTVRDSTPVHDKWMWTWGGRSQNLFLGSIAGVPIPEHLNTLDLNTGFKCGFRRDRFIAE